MNEFERAIIPAINKLEGYHILNSIKPTYFQTKFPYDELTTNKIVLTRRKIETMAVEYDSKKQKTKFGGSAPSIIFYG